MHVGELIFNTDKKTLSYIDHNGQLTVGKTYILDKVSYIFNSLGDLIHGPGEANIKGYWYLFRTGNKVLTGFQKLRDGRTVYYKPETGQMQYGEQRIGKGWTWYHEDWLPILSQPEENRLLCK